MGSRMKDGQSLFGLALHAHGKVLVRSIPFKFVSGNEVIQSFELLGEQRLIRDCQSQRQSQFLRGAVRRSVQRFC